MTAIRKAAMLGAVVLAILVARPIVTDRLDPRGFVEREQGIVLPDSATDLQIVRYRSFFMWRLVNLDRTTSAIFVIDRSDLDEFLGQQYLQDLPIPDNAADISPLQQPGAPEVPWESGSAPERALRSVAPPSTADTMIIELYGLSDPERVAVWLTSDWD